MSNTATKLKTRIASQPGTITETVKGFEFFPEGGVESPLRIVPRFQAWRDSLEKQIDQLLEKCMDENWDGEGALPLSRKTAESAKTIVSCLPNIHSNHSPDVRATPRDEVKFDWLVSKDMILTIGTDSEGMISYAGVLEIMENQKWEGRFPVGVLEWFKTLSTMPTDV